MAREDSRHGSNGHLGGTGKWVGKDTEPKVGGELFDSRSVRTLASHPDQPDPQSRHELLTLRKGPGLLL